MNLAIHRIGSGSTSDPDITSPYQSAMALDHSVSFFCFALKRKPGRVPLQSFRQFDLDSYRAYWRLVAVDGYVPALKDRRLDSKRYQAKPRVVGQTLRVVTADESGAENCRSKLGGFRIDP